MNSDLDKMNSHKRTAYITLDDGPNKYTYDILELLKKYDINVTFFLLEPNIIKNKELVIRLIDDGHTVGLHGVSHDSNIIYRNEKAFIDEMNACNDTLENVTGMRTSLIRAPYGSFPKVNKNFRNAIKDEGYILWDWNIDSTDSLKPNASISDITEVTKNQILKLQNEKIDPVILFHDKNNTKEVLTNIIHFLQKEHYMIKPLNENMKPICFWNQTEENFEPYTVVKGDSLWKISQKYRLSIQKIKQINGLTTDTIYPDQILYANPKSVESNHLPSQLIVHGNITKKQIAFTYDAGFEDTETLAILDVLKKHKIKCTFFLTGFWVERFPELSKKSFQKDMKLVIIHINTLIWLKFLMM